MNVTFENKDMFVIIKYCFVFLMKLIFIAQYIIIQGLYL